MALSPVNTICSIFSTLSTFARPLGCSSWGAPRPSKAVPHRAMGSRPGPGMATERPSFRGGSGQRSGVLAPARLFRVDARVVGVAVRAVVAIAFAAQIHVIQGNSQDARPRAVEQRPRPADQVVGSLESAGYQDCRIRHGGKNPAV